MIYNHSSTPWLQVQISQTDAKVAARMISKQRQMNTSIFEYFNMYLSTL